MSGFAPRCGECGAWQRMFRFGDDAASVRWRRGVTLGLAVVASLIAYADLQRLHRVQLVVPETGNEAPAGVAPAASNRVAEAPTSATGPSDLPVRPPHSIRLPGDVGGGSGAAPGTRTQSGASGARSATSGATSNGGSTTTGAAPSARSSISSTFLAWLQRIAPGARGDASSNTLDANTLDARTLGASTPRDSVDSLARAVARRVRGPLGVNPSRTSRVARP